MSRSLSKSKLLAYRQCAKRLWLEVHAPDKVQHSAATERRFQVGQDVGEVARRLYDPQGRGVLVDMQREGFSEAIARSAELMAQPASEARPVFEAALSYGKAFALADVMLPLSDTTEQASEATAKATGKGKSTASTTGNTTESTATDTAPAEPSNKAQWKMIEVKSSTRVKDTHRDDVAVQLHVARAAGVDVQDAVVACVDSSWVYPGEQQYEGLFKEADLTKEASSRDEEIRQWVDDGHAIIARSSAPEIATGKHCDSPFPCGFYEFCRSQEVGEDGEAETEFPARWLPEIRKKALKKLIYEDGIADMREVPDNLLNTRQKRVKQCTIEGSCYADYKGARKTLGKCKFPLAFLDFETIYFAVPQWAGTRPYQQLVFQYSLHSLDESGKLEHREFLDLSGNDPSRTIAESLVQHISGSGTVFAYFAGFERRCILDLAARFPDLAPGLKNISKRIVDMLPFMRDCYYHHAQKGSFSLKHVLPTVAPELDYGNLDGVQDGGMAMEAYAEAIHADTPPARKKDLEQQLLKYCERDTLALVRLYQFWQ